MRKEFLDSLLAAAMRDASVMLVVGDLGFGVVDEFAERLPGQFINAGVSEQNMIGMAAGLAHSGFRPFVYSIANFPSLRCLEQIRNDLCYTGLGVTVVSVGAGLAYGSLGYSHFAVEDLAVMRALPGMTVLSPADPVEASVAVGEVLRSTIPAYIRLGKGGEPTLHSRQPSSLRSPLALVPGQQLSIVSTGSAVGTCIQASAELRAAGVDAEVVSLPMVKPLNSAWLVDRDQDVPIVIVEEHRLEGGLGSALLEVLCDLGVRTRVIRIGLDQGKLDLVGSPSFLREQYGITPSRIVSAALEVLREQDLEG